MKLSRGQKRCKHCKAVNASRSLKCTNCGKRFVSKNTPIKNEIKDWRSLEAGESLRIIQGTGQYFTCKRKTEEADAGDKIYMGCKGKYQVVSVDSKGLICRGIGKKNCGIEFVYMGEKNFCEYTGITKEAHRLVRIKTRKRK